MSSIPVSVTAQTGSQITGSVTASSLKPGSRTFSLTGTMGTTIVKGDVVAIWGSNDGGRTFQPLRTAKDDQVLLTFGNPECVIDDACDTYATQRVAVGAGSALVAVGFNGEPTGISANPPWVQGGNSGFAPLGILGTTDPTPFRLIVEGIDLLDSDGTLTAFGNSEVLQPGSKLDLLAGSGSGSWIVDGVGDLTFDVVGSGQVKVGTGIFGTGACLFGTKTTDHVTQIGGVTLVSPLSLRAGTGAFAITRNGVTWGWPNADAIAANARAALITDAAGNLSFGNSIQSGTANLTNGVSAAIPANITATSLIFVQAADVVPGAGNLTIDYRPLAADRVIGTPGSFKITAVLAAGTINAADQSQGVQWMVLNA